MAKKKKTDSKSLLPIVPTKDFLNPSCVLPYGLKPQHILSAMEEFASFLSFVDEQLLTKSLPRLEEMLMPANFSSIVGEFMGSNIPKYCKTVAKNQYHNGHPDIIPVNLFDKNMCQYSEDGIEIKASRYLRGWQGHNPESVFLIVFVFDSNRPVDNIKEIPTKPFRFLEVLGAKLEKSDWLYAGRSETSRRTITASVTPTGYQKMSANWIYRDRS